MIIRSEDPGPWLNWMKRPENKSLNINEARIKYNREQMLFNEQQNAYIATQNFQNQQAALQADMSPNAGFTKNQVTRVQFVLNSLKAIPANTGSIVVGFQHPVTVTGTPQITVQNGQQGGGSAATFPYSYVSGTGTNAMLFQHNHASASNNDSGIAAHVLTLDNEIVGSVTTQPTTATADTYVAETLTWAQGTGGTGGNNVTATIVVGDLEIVDSIKITDNASGVFSPGNTLTLAGSNLGGGGNLIITLRDQDLTGDIITIGGQTIALNGGTIKTGGPNANTQTQDAIRRQGLIPETNFNSVPVTQTVTAN
jgi:hypothetical protein